MSETATTVLSEVTSVDGIPSCTRWDAGRDHESKEIAEISKK